MAKPLGQKSRVIREAISAHPAKGNTELADLINQAEARKVDKLKVTAQDVATQKQALKRGSAPSPAAPPRAGNGRKKPGRKPGRKPQATPAASVASTTSHGGAAPAKVPAGNVVTHLEAIRAAVISLGADQVKRIADLFD